MIDLYNSCGLENDYEVILLQVGQSVDVVLPSLFLHGVCLQWVNRIKYLSVWIVAG
jgi:hypothetical protein